VSVHASVAVCPCHQQIGFHVTVCTTLKHMVVG